MSTNPYSTPPTDDTDGHEGPSPRVPSNALLEIARSVFLEWEKLRPIYNILLIVLVLCTAALTDADMLTSFPFWASSIAGALFVNLCYFAAPIVETYVTGLGYRGKALRLTLFILGTGFTAIMALLVTLLRGSPF